MGLRSSVVAVSGHGGRSLHAVLHHYLVASLVHLYFAIVGDLLLLCDDPDILAAVQASVVYLRLEGEMSDLGEIDIVHFDEVFHGL